MLDIPIVDAHLHLWNPQKFRYPWLDNVPLLNKPFLLDDYDRDCGPVKVERMVFLQCECAPRTLSAGSRVGDGTGVARPSLQGIVAWAPLEKGEGVRAELAALAENRFVKGIRRIIQFKPDLNFCLQPNFVRGVQMLADYNLSFDICIKGDQQFANAVQLVEQCPQVNFILDHIGKPSIKEKWMEPWGRFIREMASLPNACCKISGLVTEADFKLWTKLDLRPYIDTVMAAFGWERVLFGGDWPVACQAITYPRWVEILEEAVTGASQSQLKKLFHDNALKFYRLS